MFYFHSSDTFSHYLSILTLLLCLFHFRVIIDAWKQIMIGFAEILNGGEFRETVVAASSNKLKPK